MRLLIMLVASVSIPLGLDLYIPVPESNPLTAEKIALGRRLFNDRRLSRDRTVACASCHMLGRAFSDGRIVAVGVSGRTGRRNVPALLNRAYGRAFFWDGRSTALEEQVLRPIEDPNEMDLPADEAAARVGLDRMTMAHALASYVRSILAGDSRYDRFLSGDRSALPRDEAAGLAVFRGKGNCIACHIGPTLSDEQFHNTGLPGVRKATRRLVSCSTRAVQPSRTAKRIAARSKRQRSATSRARRRTCTTGACRHSKRSWIFTAMAAGQTRSWTLRFGDGISRWTRNVRWSHFCDHFRARFEKG